MTCWRSRAFSASSSAVDLVISLPAPAASLAAVLVGLVILLSRSPTAWTQPTTFCFTAATIFANMASISLCDVPRDRNPATGFVSSDVGRIPCGPDNARHNSLILLTDITGSHYGAGIPSVEDRTTGENRKLPS